MNKRNTEDYFCQAGDILVRIRRDWYYMKEGDMGRLVSDGRPPRFEGIEGVYSKRSYRLATTEEVAAFNRGIRNIKDINLPAINLETQIYF